MVQSHAPKLNAVPVDLADLNVFSSTSHACRGEDIGTRRLLTQGHLAKCHLIAASLPLVLRANADADADLLFRLRHCAGY